jgi:hypothetical protein
MVFSLDTHAQNGALLPPSPPQWPLLIDADQDGLTDADEILLWLNPLDAADGLSDLDGDGLSLAWEWQIDTAPDRADTDADGWSDSDELLVHGTDPRDATSRPADAAQVQTSSASPQPSVLMNVVSTTATATAPPSLINGDFTNASAPRWYDATKSTSYQGRGFKWGEGTASGWTAYRGSSIEIWQTNGQSFVELDGNKGSYGIKQPIANARAGGFVMTWKQSGRNDKESKTDAYSVRVYSLDAAGKEVVISQSPTYQGFDKLKWTDNAHAFTITDAQITAAATNPIYVAFIPKDLNTFGTLIDDVSLLPMELKQDNMPNFGEAENTTDMASSYSTATISGDGVAYITGQPAMPQLKASFPRLAANINVEWKLEIKTERTERGTKDDKNYPASGYKTLPGNQAWDIGAEFGTDFVGGNCKLFYKVGGGAEQTLEFFIRGKNPKDATAKEHVQQTQGNYRFAWAMVQHESRQGNRCYNQFNSGGSTKEKPNLGPPDGWGIAQLDKPLGVSASTTEVYEWKANVTKMYAELQQKEQMAQSYFNIIQSVYPSKWEAPPNPANSAQGFPSVATNMTPLEAAVVQLYNGGAVIIRVKNNQIVTTGGTAYVSCWRFHPNNASGQKWEFVPNQNNYVYKVLHDEFEGHATVTE